MELSAYEQQREPHKVQDEDQTVSLPWAGLLDQMKCPVCLNLIDEAWATECMHRFCGECIKRCLRSNKKECPTCRKPCASKRSLRRDERFDGLINMLFPDPDIVEDMQDQIMERLHQTTNMRAVAESIQEGMQHQAMQRKLRTSIVQNSKAQHTPKPPITSSSRVPTVPAASASAQLRRQQRTHGSRRSTSSASHERIELLLRPMPRRKKGRDNGPLPAVQHSHVMCPAGATGSMLCKLVHTLLAQDKHGDPGMEVELLYERESRMACVGPRLQLKTIARGHYRWHPDKQLIIYYRCK